MWRLSVHETLNSTSELCRERAAAGEPAGLAVMARRQQRGRGSFGRSWDSPQGNLYLSVLLRPAGPVCEGGLWSLLAAVALAEAVEVVLPDPAALRLKWPNDLMLNGGKVAGILLDSTAGADGRLAAIVIGFGLNIASRPDIPDRPVACLADVIAPPGPDAMAGRLLDRLGHWSSIQSATGFAPIRDAWLARSHAIGTPMRLRHGSADLDGDFAGLAEDGSILLDIRGQRRAFAAGEVRMQAGGA